MMRSGQITVLVLLLGLLGLTTALSAASRSLSDLKQVTQVDVGTKAFAAAEAGLEFALNDFSKNFNPSCTNQDITTNLFPSGVNANIKSLTYTICPNNTTYAKSATTISKDDVFQVDLPAGNPNNLQSVNIVWDTAATSIEVDVISYTNVVKRYYFNSTGSGYGNGFTAGSLVGSCTSDLAFSSWSGCAVGIPNIASARMVRIKPLYSGANIAVFGQTSTGLGNLPYQNYIITVTATTTNDTVKKLQATKTQPTLPTVFDYVLFSDGNIAKP